MPNLSLVSSAPPSDVPYAPPMFLPLALHLFGAGLLLMAAALFGVVALLIGAPLATTTWTGTAMLTGQALALLGLFLAGRRTPTSMRHWFARVGTAVWGTALAIDVSRGDVRTWLSEHLPQAERLPQLTGWVAWAVALSLVAWMTWPTFRAVGRRRWPLAIGAGLVACQALTLAWLLFVRPNVSALAASLTLRLARVAPGAVGLFLSGAAIFILARALQARLVFDDAPASDEVRAAKSKDRKRPASKRRR